MSLPLNSRFPYKWFGAGLAFCVCFFLYWISYAVESSNPKINDNYLFQIAFYLILFFLLVAVPRNNLSLPFSLLYGLMASGFLSVFYFNVGSALFGWAVLFLSLMLVAYLRVLYDGIFYFLLIFIPALTLIFSMLNWTWAIHLMKLSPLGLCQNLPNLENGYWFLGFGSICALILRFKKHERHQEAVSQ